MRPFKGKAYMGWDGREDRSNMEIRRVMPVYDKQHLGSVPQGKIKSII